jgi:hypothetical protein
MQAADFIGLGNVDGNDNTHTIVSETLEHLHDVDHPEGALQAE